MAKLLDGPRCVMVVIVWVAQRARKNAMELALIQTLARLTAALAVLYALQMNSVTTVFADARLDISAEHLV
jgi:hypothetical protein